MVLVFKLPMFCLILVYSHFHSLHPLHGVGTKLDLQGLFLCYFNQEQWSMFSSILVVCKSMQNCYQWLKIQCQCLCDSLTELKVRKSLLATLNMGLLTHFQNYVYSLIMYPKRYWTILIRFCFFQYHALLRL